MSWGRVYGALLCCLWVSCAGPGSAGSLDEERLAALKPSSSLEALTEPELQWLVVNHPGLRNLAAGRLSDPSLLSLLRRASPDAAQAIVEALREERSLSEAASLGYISAARRLKDPLLKEQLALKVRDCGDLMTALVTGLDRPARERLLRGPGPAVMKMVVLQQESDLDYLAGLVRGPAALPAPELRQVLLRWLVDPTLLAQVAQEDSDEGVRAAATAKLRDRALLLQLLSDPSLSVRQAALTHLPQEDLKRLVLTGADDLSPVAVKLLQDREFLLWLESNGSASVRPMARQRRIELAALPAVAQP